MAEFEGDASEQGESSNSSFSCSSSIKAPSSGRGQSLPDGNRYWSSRGPFPIREDLPELRDAANATEQRRQGGPWSPADQMQLCFHK